MCAGLANYLGVDPTVMRVATVIGLFLTGIFPIAAIYLVLSLIIPQDGEDEVEIETPTSDITLEAV